MKKVFIAAMGLLFTSVITAQSYRGIPNPQTVEDKLNEMYCTGMFRSSDGVILDVAASPSAKTYLNVLDWLQGRVAGLQIYTSRTGISIPVIRGGIPGIYIDEVPVSPSFLSSLNVNDIAIIKIIKTPFFGGFNGANGAIAIYTLGGEEEEEGSSK